MPEPTDDDFDRMSAGERAAHARNRAAAKYGGGAHQQATGDGSGRGGVIIWGLAIVGAILLSSALVYSLQGQFGNLSDGGDPRLQQVQSPGGMPPPNLQPALNGPKPRR